MEDGGAPRLSSAFLYTLPFEQGDSSFDAVVLSAWAKSLDLSAAMETERDSGRLCDALVRCGSTSASCRLGFQDWLHTRFGGDLAAATWCKLADWVAFVHLGALTEHTPVSYLLAWFGAPYVKRTWPRWPRQERCKECWTRGALSSLTRDEWGSMCWSPKCCLARWPRASMTCLHTGATALPLWKRG